MGMGIDLWLGILGWLAALAGLGWWRITRARAKARDIMAIDKAVRRAQARQWQVQRLVAQAHRRAEARRHTQQATQEDASALLQEAEEWRDGSQDT